MHYWDPVLDVYGGEGVYELTPLTMLNRFGWGGSIQASPKIVSVKGIYLEDNSSVPQTSVGGQFSYKPTEPFSLSASFLQNFFSQKSETILNTSSSELSQSLMCSLQDKTFGKHTAEYAKSGNLFGSSQENQACYLYSQAYPLTTTWYALQLIYAQPNFVGYYQDTKQLYASVGFPIFPKMQGTISYNGIAYNLKNLPSYGTASRSSNVYGGISYSFPFGLYTSAYYNYLFAKNPMTQRGYKTKYGTINGGQSIKNWTFQGIVEIGNYKNISAPINERIWQNYQLYIYYHPNARAQYAVYTRIGYVQLSSNIEWARIYGVSSAWSFSALKWQLLYEYTDQTYFRNYFSTKIQYTLPNQHSFELQGYVNQQSQAKNTTEFLLSYSIPWGIPIRKKKSHASIYGKVFKQSSDKEEAPYPNLLVHCNGYRTLTNKKGDFVFADLTPGEYHLWIEEKNQNWVPTDSLPKTIPLEKGDFKETNICFKQPANLEGSICLFRLFQNELEQNGYLSNASIILEATFSKERLFATSDSLGHFNLDHLAPGRWILKIPSSSIPAGHYLEDKEMIIDLFPGEMKTITLKVLPINRELRIIDVDTVSQSQSR